MKRKRGRKGISRGGAEGSQESGVRGKRKRLLTNYLTIKLSNAETIKR
jgi:hypothetical protein